MSLRRAMLCVVPFVLAALLLSGWPAAAAWCEFDRAALAAGQWHRLFLGHLAHWSTTHLFWDVATFGVLAMLAVRLAPVRFFWCVGIGAAAISLAVWALLPDLQVYRGLSGLDSALFVLVIVLLLRPMIAARRTMGIVALGTGLAAFLGKAAFEVLTGHAVFVQDLGAGITCVPVAHLVGGVVGAAVGGYQSGPWHRLADGVAKTFPDPAAPA